MNSKSTKLNFVLIIIVIVAIGALIYGIISSQKPPVIFSAKSMLSSLWGKYKDQYLEKGTVRTVDRGRDNVTTSEGESYTMLRAVWMDDHPTFDASWTWVQQNLQKQGHLFSWLFGRHSDGTFGILTEQRGQNTASDADTDIALSLCFAYARWRDPKYLESAKQVITDIWNNDVVQIGGRPYMSANNIEKNFSGDVVINPSYFAPYAYRIFAEVDPSHNWMGLTDSSYSVLSESMRSNLGRESSAQIPPDWVGLDRNTGQIRAPKVAGLDTSFGFDAMRVPWRIALDWQWNRDPRAKALLDSMKFLDDEWSRTGKLASIYKHDGTATLGGEAPSVYGGTIGHFLISNPNASKDIYENKLVSLYNPDSNSWRVTLSYYDDNWAWFGMAMYNDELPNLWATVSSNQ
jgi:endoglucanase